MKNAPAQKRVPAVLQSIFGFHSQTAIKTKRGIYLATGKNCPFPYKYRNGPHFAPLSLARSALAHSRLERMEASKAKCPQSLWNAGKFMLLRGTFG
jgi:hypothetical protein